MSREKLLEQLEDSDLWDFIVVGGGATGLGVAVEAASRGFKTLLVEQSDFAKGTSSRSTKLVHGGVRYLKQGNISLVLESLHERGLLIKNAPHLVHSQSFIVPNYSWWEGPFYGIGMKVYDVLAGKLGLAKSRHLSKEETLEYIPTLEPEGLKGGILYYDGQFDDSRLAINLAQTFEDLGGLPINYMKVKGLLKSFEMVSGVIVEDVESGKEYDLKAKVVVNATGVFVDSLLRMDNPEASSIIQASQGVHVVLDRDFLPGDSAIMVPKTNDGRIMFAVPWNDKVVVGTTDTPVQGISLEPRALEEEVEFILTTAAKYMVKAPSRADVKSVFAGLRPLVKNGKEGNTSEISRDHHLVVSVSGLVTITGGKWTTYRLMGQDTVDRAVKVAGLEKGRSGTENLRIHGWSENVDRHDPLGFYGSDIELIEALVAEDAKMGERLNSSSPYIKAQVIWAVRHEFARTVEDFLARRTRLLLLDAKASMAMAPEVASLMAEELGFGEDWVLSQIADYRALAKGYLLA